MNIKHLDSKNILRKKLPQKLESIQHFCTFWKNNIFLNPSQKNIFQPVQNTLYMPENA